MPGLLCDIAVLYYYVCGGGGWKERENDDTPFCIYENCNEQYTALHAFLSATCGRAGEVDTVRAGVL